MTVDTTTTLNRDFQFIKSPAVSKSGVGVFDESTTSGATNTFEMFDIIDNVIVDANQINAAIYIQPSNRTRVNQLAKLKTLLTSSNSPSIASLFYLMSRTRIRSVKEHEDPNTNEKTVTAFQTLCPGYYAAAGYGNQYCGDRPAFPGTDGAANHLRNP